jgi:hypothetical protein
MARPSTNPSVGLTGRANGGGVGPGALWDASAEMAARKRRPKARADDPLAAYRRIRKPVPPPERVEQDERRDMREREAEREIRERE